MHSRQYHRICFSVDKKYDGVFGLDACENKFIVFMANVIVATGTKRNVC